MHEFGAGIVAVITGIIGLAMVAVILSSKANTQNVISSSGTALSSIIGAAVNPVTGGGSTYGSAPAQAGVSA